MDVQGQPRGEAGAARCALSSPALSGTLNDYKLAVVKAKGEFVWHKHDDTDELLFALAGRLTIQPRLTASSNRGPASSMWLSVASSTARRRRRRRTYS